MCMASMHTCSALLRLGIPQKYAANNVTVLEALDAINDGGDCPELGMTKIPNVLSLSNPGFNVVVITA